MSTLILREDEGTLRVTLLRPGENLGGQESPPERFANPLSAGDLAELRWYVEDYLAMPFAVYEGRGALAYAQLPTWGKELFNAVFGVGRRARDAYLTAQASPRWELRIVSSSPDVLALPWELLKDPDHPTPLALTIGGVHRGIPSPTPSREGIAEIPGRRLRILMVIARPRGVNDIPFRMISRSLFERLEQISDRVELEMLRPPTFDALTQRLEEARTEGWPFDIVHFDGHGGFIRGGPLAGPLSGRSGVLQFETPCGDADLIGAEQLAPQLARARVPLFILNACRSAMLEEAGRVDASLAPRLLREGTGAVVAMAYTVYAAAAAEFMTAFYDVLLAGRTVTEAVTEGRLRMQRNPLRPSAKGSIELADWMVPVHYAQRDIRFGTPEPPLAEHRAAPAARSSGFFGRDAEILRLERGLRLRHVVVLHGLGGIGKTKLARAFADWLGLSKGLEGPGDVFFYSFEPGTGRRGLDGAVTSLGRALFGPDFSRLDRRQQRSKVLAELRNRRLVLIWDSFESVVSLPDPARGAALGRAEREALRSFVAEVAATAQGGIVITSRSPEAWLGDAAHRIEVAGLDDSAVHEHAEHLLQALDQARDRRQHRAYAELLETLGGHPLALRRLLPRLEHEKPSDLVAALRGEGARLEPRPDGRRLRSLHGCVASSTRRLGQQHAERLTALALFVGVIDVRMLTELSRNAEAPERFRSISESAWKATLDRCVDAGLVTPLRPHLYGLHPALPSFLVEAWKRAGGRRFTGEKEAARGAVLQAHARVASELHDRAASPGAEAAFDDLGVLRRSLGAAATAALERELPEVALRLFKALILFCNYRGRKAEAWSWLVRCRDAAEVAGPAHQDPETGWGELWLFAMFSQAAHLVRDERLEEAQEQLETIRTILEPLASDEAQRRLSGAYLQLGRVARKQGRADEAARWLDLATPLQERYADRRGLASVHLQRGLLALSRGDLDGAKEWYQSSLRLEKEHDNPPGLVKAHVRLGELARRRYDFEEAERQLRTALGIAEQLHDPSRQARSHLELGILDRWRKEHDAARRSLGRALKLAEGVQDLSLLTAIDRELGLLAEAEGADREALEWLVHAVSRCPEIPQPATSEALDDLVRLTHRVGLSELEAAWRRVTARPLPAEVTNRIADTAPPHAQEERT